MWKQWLIGVVGMCVWLGVNAASFETGDVAIVVLERGAPAQGVEVAVNGRRGEKTDAAGVAVLNVAGGQRLLTLSRDGDELAEIELQLRTGESGELIVALSGIGREVRHTFRAFPADEGSGSVSGVVRDQSGQPVDGATVTVEGRDESVMSGTEGQFELVLPRGIYSLNVSHPSLADRRFTKVRALATMNVDLELGLTQARSGPGAEMEEVTVVARMTSDTAFASERNADSVLDVLGAREISIAGDSTAAQALQRVTGVTVKDEIIFVRGLGDRYSATFFNGAELPSPDPARRAISLDIFPTFLISGITVHKTYSSDLPGDFSGGAVRLETRSIPDTLTVSLKASGGGNTLSTTADVFSHPGGDEDFLGLDDGDRDIPSPGGVLTDNGRRPLSELSDDENQQIAQAIARNFPFNLREFELPPDFSAEFGIGNRFAFDDAEVGVSLSGLYDTEWRYREEQRAEIIADATGGVFEGEGSDLERTENDVKLGGVLNVVTEIGPDHSFSLTSLLSRVSTKGTFFEQGFNRSDDQDFRRVILEFTESQLFSNQFSGSHAFPSLGYTQVDWQVVASNAKRDEPGTREYVYSRTAGTDIPFKLATGPGEAGLPPVLSWEFLDEDTVDASVDIVVPDWIFDSVVGDWKFGARFTERDRNFETVRWRYFVSAAASQDSLFQQTLGFPSLQMILTPDRIGPNGFVLRNASTALAGGSNADNYGGTHDIHAGYFMADFDIGPLRIQGGVRVESSELEVTTDAITAGSTQVGQLDETDVLPSINLTWSLTDASQLRFGASRTVNRPQFRELSPTPYRDPETRFEAVGNPLLQQAEITNVDLRYEHYFSQLDGVSIAAFYKDLTKPIEVVTIGGGSDDRGVRSFANADNGELYGIEIDGRYSLDFLERISPILGGVYIAGNLAWIESEVEVGETDLGVGTNLKRELQGQSPWVANATLGYSNPSRGTEMILMFNMFGNRIVEAGVNGAPDAREQARASLDFNLKQVVFNAFEVGFKVRNILDTEFEVSQGSLLQREFKHGRAISLSVSYEL